MANATLLQLVGRAISEMALTSAPSTVIANTDLLVAQFLNLANGLGQDLLREHEWQSITGVYRFTTVFYNYTGTTVSGSTTLSVLSSTTGLTTSPTFFAVSGPGIPQDTMLVSVNSGAATAVMSQAATVSGALVPLLFSQIIYAMPTDYDRPINRTQWDKTMRWELLGPSTAQEWEWLKSGYIATGPRSRFRVLADKFQIWPPQSDARYMGFEYVRTSWVFATAAADTSKFAFSVDTDTCIFPDRLMIESLKLRFRREGGFELTGYSPQDIAKGFITRLCDLAKTADTGAPILSMGGFQASVLIGPDNLPDGNWNL